MGKRDEKKGKCKRKETGGKIKENGFKKYGT
jgi:hypothetical protein